MNIQNKVVIITGASRGIGKAVAEKFIDEGARVVICSRNEKELNNTAGELSKKENECIPIKCDVTNSADVRNLVNRVINKFSHIDILINNAGIAYYKSLSETTEEDWDNIIDTNLKGTFLLCKEFIPYITKGGIILNISSGAGKVGFANFSAYCASKFGVIGFTESLALELPHRKVYAICPGSVNTKLFRDTFSYSPPLQPEEIGTALIKLCKTEHLPSGYSLVIDEKMSDI